MRLKKIIIGISFLIIFVQLSNLSLAQEKVYSFLSEVYSNDTVNLIQLDVVSDQPTQFPTVMTNYTLKVLDAQSKSLLEKNIGGLIFKQEITTSQGEKEITLEKITLYLKIPYFENGKSIAIYHFGKLIFLYNISVKAATICGNGICESGETSSSCPQDCKAKTSGIPFYFYIIIAIVIILIVILFVRRLKVQRV